MNVCSLHTRTRTLARMTSNVAFDVDGFTAGDDRDGTFALLDTTLILILNHGDTRSKRPCTCK